VLRLAAPRWPTGPAARRCEPLIELLSGEIRSGPVLNIDETTVQVMKEPGRLNTTKSYMWIFRGGTPEKPVLIYLYHRTRAGDVARGFLVGYKGYVQVDVQATIVLNMW
jgi:transposase